jgi:hypothetical protein
MQEGAIKLTRWSVHWIYDECRFDARIKNCGSYLIPDWSVIPVRSDPALRF